MATSTISNTIKDASGTAVGNVAVVARLKPGPGFRLSDGSEIAGQVSTATNGSGVWSLVLEETANITPTGTWWEIEEQIPELQGGRRTWAIQVGAANATLQASVVQQPPGGDVIGYLTQSAGDARYPQLGQALRVNDTLAVTLGSTGSGGGGNGAVGGQVAANLPPTFASGATLAGSTTTKAIVAGDLTALVGYYYVATGVANNPSVPVISATFDGTNTTLNFSFLGGHSSGQTFEVAAWPGGSGGRPGTNGVNTVYKPPAARAFWQIGPNVALYQVDAYGTVYLIGLNGTGANNGDHFRDFRCADLGVDAIECNGTPNDTSPAGTETARTSGLLLYHGSGIDAYRSSNSPRTKSFSVNGATGDTTVWANAASAGATTVQSPRVRTIGTYWTGSASTDRVGYVQTNPTDTSGGVQMEWGFEHRTNPWIALRDGTTGTLLPQVDLSTGLGGISNRWLQVLTGPAGFRVWNGSGDANPIAELKSTGLAFGAGGGSAVDLTVGRATDAGGKAVVSLSVDPATATTSATAGGASALPALPVGYLELAINGIVRKLPYYAV